jgi:histidinol-phosphate/aromatic aminotransferase/cobyric acid decarboxylase-like protein
MTPIVNAKVGQPFIQAEILGCTLKNTRLPCQDLTTLPYTVSDIMLPSLGNQRFNRFVLDWEKKIHITDVNLQRNYNITTSVGGSSLCAAAYLYSVTKQLNKPVVRVSSYIPPPFYGFYRLLCNDFVRGTQWIDWEQKEDGTYVAPTDIDVTVIISPNNPTGQIIENPDITSPYVLVDTVYDIFLFTGKLTSVNPWLWRYLNDPRPGDPVVTMVNSFSKFGFGGFRAGYLFTTDPLVLSMAQFYIDSFYLGTPTYDYYTLIQDNDALNVCYFNQVYTLLQRRQQEIRLYIPEELILNVNIVAPYLFVNIKEERFKKCNILVRNGIAFLYSPDYSRINLMLSTTEWQSLIEILRSGCIFHSSIL